MRIAADDLTGAGDAGAPFAARGYPTCVWLHGAEALEHCDVDVFETSSRHCDSGEAYERVRRVLRGAGDELVFKKMDSTLYGNLGAELRAVKDALGVEHVVVAPSHPRMGRTMRGGMLYIDGEASGRHLPSMLVEQGIAESWAVVCDCETEEDLERVVEEWWGRRVAFAGAGALAGALARRWVEKPPLAQPAAVGEVLVIAGSRNAVTTGQVEALLARGERGVEVVYVRREELGSAWFRERLVGWRAGAAIIAGGDTARAVAEILGARGIRLAGERIPGLPWGTWIGGEWDARPVATKAGGFGGIEVMVDAVHLLRGERI